MIPYSCEFGCCLNVHIVSPRRGNHPAVITVNDKTYCGFKAMRDSREFVGTEPTIAYRLRRKVCLRRPTAQLCSAGQHRRKLEDRGMRYRGVVSTGVFNKFLRRPGNGTGNITQQRFTRL